MIVDAEALFLDNLSEIQRIVRHVCRLRRLTPDEIEEFSGYVTLRLVEHDYAIIRKFEARSAFRTFLTTVITRLLTEYQVGMWGKWNSSAAAKRLGPIALELEQLLYRDHRPVDEALSLMQTRHPETSLDELQRIAEEIPPRIPRRKVPLDEAASIAEDPRVGAAEHARTAASIVEAVQALLREFSPEDRLILRMRFAAGMTIPEIARALNLKPFQVYQRLDRRLQKLRTRLHTAGVYAQDVEEVIGNDDARLEFMDVDYDGAATRA